MEIPNAFVKSGTIQKSDFRIPSEVRRQMVDLVRVGRNPETWARNAAAFFGRSNSMGTVVPVNRSAAVRVVVFQWPCGPGERQR